jgi:hypothetical protein
MAKKTQRLSREEVIRELGLKSDDDLNRGYAFAPGNRMHALRDVPRLNWTNGCDFIGNIPQRLHITVSPDRDGIDLLEELGVAINFAREMLAAIGSSDNVNSMKACGRYTDLITTMIKTSTEIQGGGITPGKFGVQSAEQVRDLQVTLASILSINLTKLNSGLDYARRHADDGGGIFSDNGEVKSWASDGFCNLLGGVRKTIYLRAQLDAWQHRNAKKAMPILTAYQDVLNERR